MLKSFSSEQRARVITSMHGIVKPLSEILAAMVLQVMVWIVSPREMIWVVVPLVLLWIGVLHRLSRSVPQGERSPSEKLETEISLH